MFAALSDNEDKYADKINLFVALAPIARLKDVKIDALDKYKYENLKIMKFARVNGIDELFGPSYHNPVRDYCKIFGFGCEKTSRIN